MFYLLGFNVCLFHFPQHTFHVVILLIALKPELFWVCSHGFCFLGSGWAMVYGVGLGYWAIGQMVLELTYMLFLLVSCYTTILAVELNLRTSLFLSSVVIYTCLYDMQVSTNPSAVGGYSCKSSFMVK